MECVEWLLSSGIKTEVLPFFQEAGLGGNLSLWLDLDVQQGLVLLGLALPLCQGLGQL